MKQRKKFWETVASRSYLNSRGEVEVAAPAVKCDFDFYPLSRKDANTWILAEDFAFNPSDSTMKSDETTEHTLLKWPK